MAQVEVAGLTGAEADKQYRAGIDARGHMQCRAVFGEHGVEGHDFVQCGLGEGAKGRGTGGRGRGGQLGVEAAIDEDQTRRVDPRQAGEQARNVRRRLSVMQRQIGQRAQLGVAPFFLTRAGQTGARKQRCASVADRQITRQAGSQAVIARHERLSVRLQQAGGNRRVHAASATTAA